MSENLKRDSGSTCKVSAGLAAVLFSGLLLAGCDSTRQAKDVADSEAVEIDVSVTDLVWAVNVGGPAYTGIDGTEFLAEESVSGGEIGTMKTVKGSQDPFLYKSYREGDIQVAHPLPDGTYDVTFHFAEPKEYAARERVFDAFAEDERVIDDLDVMLFRDGKVVSALTVTAPNVVVADGELNIRFEASADQPTLSALVVRDKNRPAENWKLVWSDEFDGDALDAEKWSPNIWPARKVNDEDQAYTPREKNLRVEDGKLIVEAHKEDYEGAQLYVGSCALRRQGGLLIRPLRGAREIAARQRHMGGHLDVAERPFPILRQHAKKARTGRAAQPATPGPIRARSTSWNTWATRWATSMARFITRLTTGSSGSSARAAFYSMTSTRLFTSTPSNGRRRGSTSSSMTRITSPTSTKKAVGRPGLMTSRSM